MPTPPPAPGSLLVTDFSRGWDPTHTDEQLIGANGAPGEQFGAAAGAPFKSPDIHDVDFWNGFLNKRNGKIFLGSAIGHPMLGLFMYLYTTISGVISRVLVAFCNSQFQIWNGSTWSQQVLNWTLATYVYYETLKNLLFMSSSKVNDTYIPRWWDGASTNLGYHGTRLSPFYQLFFGGNYTADLVSSISGTVITLAANQTASGLFRGKTVWLLNQGLFMEPAIISSFVTTGTAGTANYYVTSITLQNPLKYNVASYTYVCWNGCSMAAATTGGTMTIASPQTTVRILAVTNLQSGGQRASEMSVDVPVGTTCSITLANIQMAFGDGQPFGTDIPNNATTWYMTAPFNPQLTPSDPNSGPSQIFYRIPDNQGTATDTSTGYNPMPNSTSGFTIKTARNTSSDTTLVADQAVDAQGYFTGQVDVPFYKFAKAWQDFLVLFGDIWNPSSIWISAFGAPQVFGTQGGLDGSFIQVPNGNDGQTIIAAYVWRGDLYIFKTNSVYVLQFSGNTSISPFVLTKLQGNYGPVSPGCIAEGDNYLYFLSPSGLCAVSGLTVALLPENEQIRAKFVGPNTWNLALMSNALAISFPVKKQIHFQVAVASIGDQVLVYDWARRTFWYDTGAIQESSLLQDLSSSPPVPYGGDSNGQLFQLDYPGSDETIPIDFSYETPWLNFGDPSAWKILKRIWLTGSQQVSGSLHVELYVDYSLKAIRTYDFDMTDPNFQIGLQQNIGLRNKYFKLKLTNNDQGVGVAIRALRFDYENIGEQI